MLGYSYENMFFFIFSLLSIISLILIVFSNKEIYSILFLIFFFLNISCLLLILKIEFIAALIILIYISAITIFFLFIIMTTNLKINNKTIRLKLIEIISLIAIISIILILNSSFIFEYFTPELYNKISTLHVNEINNINSTYLENNIRQYTNNIIFKTPLNLNFFEYYLPTFYPYGYSNIRVHDIDFFMIFKNSPYHWWYCVLAGFYEVRTDIDPFLEHIGLGNIIEAQTLVVEERKNDIYDYNPFIPDFEWSEWWYFENMSSILENKYLNEILNNNDLLFSSTIFNSTLPNVVGLYSNLEFHSLFYNFFVIELLSIGFILLITLLGVVMLTVKRGEHTITSNLEKTEPLNYIFKIL